MLRYLSQTLESERESRKRTLLIFGENVRPRSSSLCTASTCLRISITRSSRRANQIAPRSTIFDGGTNDCGNKAVELLVFVEEEEAVVWNAAGVINSEDKREAAADIKASNSKAVDMIKFVC